MENKNKIQNRNKCGTKDNAIKKVTISTGILIVFAIMLILFMSGCAQKGQYIPCCVDTGDEITCYYGDLTFTQTQCPSDNIDPNCRLRCDDNGCHAWNVELPDGTVTDFASMGWCETGQFNPCVKEGCFAMVCGDTTYDPRESPSYCLLANQDTSFIKMFKDIARGLYGTKCSFSEMDEQTMKKLNKGGWVNAFRAGVGKTFEDYETARWYFPITDKATHANPSGFVDRFKNYWPQAGADIDDILEFQTGADLCEFVEDDSAGSYYYCPYNDNITISIDIYHVHNATAD